ncbi:MAG: glutamate synthase, partial [Spirochaetota bacterium]|nr:glutamate synthase [Spirochaetota bacterium]
MSTKIESNYIVERTKNYQYPAYSEEKGVKKVVAFGDHSHKCPVYTLRIPPCTAGCPSGEDIRSYLNLLRGIEKSKNKWEAAWRKIVDKNPFPAVMGRVCPHPCESKCNRQFHDENISINAVEHAIGEYGLQNNLSFEKPTIKTSKHIAVIGGGPAGLSA